MQMIGNISKCWLLTASASNVIAVLGYHKTAETVPRSTLDQEIHAAVAWCYLFDKSTSMLLQRPQRLPKLRVRPTGLIHAEESSPMTRFVRLMMELAEKQEVILDLADGQGVNMYGRIDRVRSSLVKCGSQVQDVRAFCWVECEHADNSNFQLLSTPQSRGTAVHLLMFQFMYHSIVTAAMRLTPNLVSDSSSREECVEHARKALLSLKDVQAYAKDSDDIAMNHFYFFWWALTCYFISITYNLYKMEGELTTPAGQ